MGVTIKDIARICNVSEGTVDRAVNDRSGISVSTKQKILEKIKELNYKPHRIAQSLAMGRTMFIGIVCFDLQNNFLALLVDVIEAIAKKRGYFISLVLTHGEIDKEWEGIEYLAERKVDGIIVFPIGLGEQYVNYLKGLKIPIVSIYNKISDDFPYIGINAYNAMKDAVYYMAEKGYQRVLLLNSQITKKKQDQINVYTLEQRQQGYIDGITESSIQPYPIIVEGLNFELIRNLILDNKEYKTGVLCICDMFALEVLEYCKELGLRVPEDVGIMGFDNMPYLKYVSPKLASVGYDVKNMGEKAFDVLIDLVEKKEDFSCEYCLDYIIVGGESL